MPIPFPGDYLHDAILDTVPKTSVIHREVAGSLLLVALHNLVADTLKRRFPDSDFSITELPERAPE